jgi:hypothetical protein
VLVHAPHKIALRGESMRKIAAAAQQKGGESRSRTDQCVTHEVPAPPDLEKWSAKTGSGGRFKTDQVVDSTGLRN